MSNENHIDFTVRVKNDGLGELAADVGKVEEGAKDLSTASAAAGDALDQLDAGARQAGEGVDALAKAQDEAAEQSAELGAGTDTASQDVADMGQAAQQARGNVEQLAAAESQAGEDARALGTSTQAASKGVQDVGRAADQAGSELADLRKEVDAKTAAIKSGLRVEQSEIELQRQHLAGSKAELQARLQAAQAKGDEAAATRAQNALRQVESDQLALVARAKRAEATAVQQATAARREELAAVGPLTAAQAQELQAAENHARALRVEAAAADQAAQRAKELGTAHRNSAGATDQLSARVTNLTGLLGQMAGALGAAFTFRELVTAAAQMEQLRSGLTAVTQDAAKAGEELEFVRVVANRIGADVAEVGKAFLGLAASTRGTAVEGEPTRQVFEAVATAMGKAGKSSAETSNALQALSQMASKGVVQSEELRGQLGEALPGALNAAAKGLGITTAELMKLVEEGKIAAEDLFPALTRGLNELYGSATAVKTLTQELANVKNAATSFAEGIGDAGGMALLKRGAQEAQAAFVELEAGFISTGKTIGVVLGALRTLDFSGVKQAFADIETESRDKLVKAALNNDLLRRSIQESGNEALKSALAQQQAGAATAAAGTAAAQSADNWVRLNNGYRLVLDSVREQIAQAEKSVIARDAEGKAAVALAQAFGTEKEQRAAQAKATEANALALAQVAQQRLTELNTLQAQLESLKAEGAAQGKLSEERQKQLAELEKLIALRKQETDKAVAQAGASKIAAEHAMAEAQAYADNSGRLGELKEAYLQTEKSVVALRAAREAGLATAEQVAEAERKAGAAALLYRDALADQARAITAAKNLQLVELDAKSAGIRLAVEQQRVIYEVAKARGDESTAMAAQNEMRKLEVQLLELTAQAKKAEADAALEMAKVRKEEAIASDEYTGAKKLEIDAALKAAEVKRKEAEIAKVAAAGARELAEATSQATTASQKAGDSAEDAGRKTQKSAEAATQSVDSLVSMWWTGTNAASKYAQAVNKAMWETVRFAPQTDASFAAMSAQANKMIETLEGIDAAQRKLQQSAQGNDAALADLRMRLLEIDGTEEEIAAAKAERERNQIELELQRLQLEMERARVWKDNAKLAELDKEIAKQKEMLALLGQIHEKERDKRKKEEDERAQAEREQNTQTHSERMGQIDTEAGARQTAIEEAADAERQAAEDALRARQKADDEALKQRRAAEDKAAKERLDAQKKALDDAEAARQAREAAAAEALAARRKAEDERAARAEAARKAREAQERAAAAAAAQQQEQQRQAREAAQQDKPGNRSQAELTAQERQRAAVLAAQQKQADEQARLDAERAEAAAAARAKRLADERAAEDKATAAREKAAQEAHQKRLRELDEAEQQRQARVQIEREREDASAAAQREREEALLKAMQDVAAAVVAVAQGTVAAGLPGKGADTGGGGDRTAGGSGSGGSGISTGTGTGAPGHAPVQVPHQPAAPIAISYITLPGGKTERIGFDSAASQAKATDLLRQLAAARGTAL